MASRDVRRRMELSLDDLPVAAERTNEVQANLLYQPRLAGQVLSVKVYSDHNMDYKLQMASCVEAVLRQQCLEGLLASVWNLETVCLSGGTHFIATFQTGELGQATPSSNLPGAATCRTELEALLGLGGFPGMGPGQGLKNDWLLEDLMEQQRQQCNEIYSCLSPFMSGEARIDIQANGHVASYHRDEQGRVTAAWVDLSQLCSLPYSSSLKTDRHRPTSSEQLLCNNGTEDIGSCSQHARTCASAVGSGRRGHCPPGILMVWPPCVAVDEGVQEVEVHLRSTCPGELLQYPLRLIASCAGEVLDDVLLHEMPENGVLRILLPPLGTLPSETVHIFLTGAHGQLGGVVFSSASLLVLPVAACTDMLRLFSSIVDELSHGQDRSHSDQSQLERHQGYFPIRMTASQLCKGMDECMSLIKKNPESFGLAYTQYLSPVLSDLSYILGGPRAVGLGGQHSLLPLHVAQIKAAYQEVVQQVLGYLLENECLHIASLLCKILQSRELQLDELTANGALVGHMERLDLDYPTDMGALSVHPVSSAQFNSTNETMPLAHFRPSTPETRPCAFEEQGRHLSASLMSGSAMAFLTHPNSSGLIGPGSEDVTPDTSVANNTTCLTCPAAPRLRSQTRHLEDIDVDFLEGLKHFGDDLVDDLTESMATNLISQSCALSMLGRSTGGNTLGTIAWADEDLVQDLDCGESNASAPLARPTWGRSGMMQSPFRHGPPAAPCRHRKSRQHLQRGVASPIHLHEEFSSGRGNEKSHWHQPGTPPGAASQPSIERHSMLDSAMDLQKGKSLDSKTGEGNRVSDPWVATMSLLS